MPLTDTVKNANSDKKLGRRKAGSWGRATKGRRKIANRATRRIAKNRLKKQGV